MKKELISIATLSLISQGSFSQDVGLSVKDIKEVRHLEQEDSFLELTLEIAGVKVDATNKVKLKEITRATDEEGNALRRIESFFGEDFNNRNQLALKLSAPSRKSGKLSSLEGIIEVFSPSESSGTKVVIENPLDYYNKNLLGKSSTDMKLTLVEEEKEDEPNEFDEQVEKLKEEGAVDEGMVGVLDAFQELFESSDSESRESISFYTEDDEDEIAEILIYDGQGEKMNNGYKKINDDLTIFLEEKVAADWKIVILIKNEKSLKEYKFSLTDIVLP